MTDTVYEKNNISFTRFWNRGDWVQITFLWEDDKGPINVYKHMSIDDFREAVAALEANIKETDTAWWHKIMEAEAKK